MCVFTYVGIYSFCVLFVWKIVLPVFSVSRSFRDVSICMVHGVYRAATAEASWYYYYYYYYHIHFLIWIPINSILFVFFSLCVLFFSFCSADHHSFHVGSFSFYFFFLFSVWCKQKFPYELRRIFFAGMPNIHVYTHHQTIIMVSLRCLTNG